jgi:hypothetical protein
MPDIAFSSVDFPAPLEPSRATMPPLGTAMLTSRIASMALS